jgi:hypothetical protein
MLKSDKILVHLKIGPCNICHSKSIVQKLSFLRVCIVINDELVLLIIKGKWFEAIVHMIEFKFLDLRCLKQVQLFIHIHNKF